MAKHRSSSNKNILNLQGCIFKINLDSIYKKDLFGDYIPGIQNKPRPCLVVSNNKFNTFAPIVNVVTISRQPKDSPVHVELPEECAVDGFVFCEQWLTVPKSMLSDNNYIGNVDALTMGKIIERVIHQMRYQTFAEFEVSI